MADTVENNPPRVVKMDVRVDPIDEWNYFSMDSCDGLFGPSVIGLVFFFGDLMEKDPSLGVFFCEEESVVAFSCLG